MPKSPTRSVPPQVRDVLLLRWLGPKVEGDKEAGRFAGRPTRELAKAFNRRFRTELSERTVLRYIHQAVARATRRAETATRHAAVVGRVGVFVPPPEVALPTRGRPKSGGGAQAPRTQEETRTGQRLADLDQPAARHGCTGSEAAIAKARNRARPAEHCGAHVRAPASQAGAKTSLQALEPGLVGTAGADRVVSTDAVSPSPEISRDSAASR
ncbi:hypothetical protein FG147_05755 [Thauera sp. UPWRP]|nr:hypothetical protein FG147_05755 [Thauera sp. UPWRP]